MRIGIHVVGVEPAGGDATIAPMLDPICQAVNQLGIDNLSSWTTTSRWPRCASAKLGVTEVHVMPMGDDPATPVEGLSQDFVAELHAIHPD